MDAEQDQGEIAITPEMIQAAADILADRFEISRMIAEAIAQELLDSALCETSQNEKQTP